MLTTKITTLINATNKDDEQSALSDLLAFARKNYSNYGYQVFNVTKNKPTLHEELHNETDDELVVTILIGEEPPYKEYKWVPKDNSLIQFLIMP